MAENQGTKLTVISVPWQKNHLPAAWRVEFILKEASGRQHKGRLSRPSHTVCILGWAQVLDRAGS
jgi:hypothetical protein